MPYTRLHYHLVWSTKNREPLIDEAAEQAITWSYRKTADRLNLQFHACGMVSDHSHLAISIPPSLTVAEVVRALKGASSHAVNQLEREAQFAWQREHAALTFSDRSLVDVVAYVSNQKQRHADKKLISEMERDQ